MNPAVLIASIYVFALAAFLGYQVISRVPPLLHTPLMSATNAISGISLIGSIVLAGAAHYPLFAHILGFVAVTTATINVVGGFGITDRMLKMFNKRNEAKPEEGGGQMSLSTYFMEATYLVASILFVLALKGMSHPETARRGMFLAEGGMLAAIIGTLIGAHIVTWVWIIAGLSDRLDHRRVDGHLGSDDRHAAANRALARLRSAGRGAGRHWRIPRSRRRNASCHPRRAGL